MILKILKLTLLLTVLVTFSSCKGHQNTKPINNSLKGKLVSELDNQIWAIHQDKKGNYWFGSNGNGVFYYDGTNLKQYTKKDGLVDNTIREIQEDNLGNVFIGTPKGISKYNGTSFTTLKPIISSLNKWKLEPNDLWFNCIQNNIHRYDGKSLFELKLPKKDLKKAFGTEVKGVPFKGMNNSPYAVYGINKDNDGNMWFGTISVGAFRYDGKSFLWIAEKELSVLPDGRVPGVRSILQDKNGYFWLSNFISKYKIDNTNDIITYKKLKGVDTSNKHFQNSTSYFFNSGLSDNKGNLWMTIYSGHVWKYDGNKRHYWKIGTGETQVLLISIYEDNKGVLWLGTDNDGVYRFNGETFEKFEPIKNKGRNK